MSMMSSSLRWLGWDMNTRAAIFLIVTTSFTESYGLMKMFLTEFKIEGIVAVTIKGR